MERHKLYNPHDNASIKGFEGLLWFAQETDKRKMKTTRNTC